MNDNKNLSKVFETAQFIPFDDSSKIIIMSDCHRGDGSWADSFCKNKNIYYAALTHYYNNNYTYIELGDGDELWENKDIYEIMNQHSDVFLLLSKFVSEGRGFFLYGNHDLVKKCRNYAKFNKYRCLYEREAEKISLFENIKFHEGLVLKHSVTGGEIFLIHGHQLIIWDGAFWRLTRFLVRYFWKPLELIGVNDPTSTAKNYKRKALVEKKLIKWIKKNNRILIAGHTHRPTFPEVGELPYFNDGSCIHPYGITGIEIEDGHISLVEWSIKTKTDGVLYVDRSELAGPEKLNNYFEIPSGHTLGVKE